MQEDLVHLIHGVLHHGIRLRKRLLRGERLVLENEQATLQRLLLPAGEAQRRPEYGGQSPASTEPTDLHAADVHAGTGPRLFLGVRYALVCWLDELFLVGSPWEKQWNEKKLEAVLYASNDRAWRFWSRLGWRKRGRMALLSWGFSCASCSVSGATCAIRPRCKPGWTPRASGSTAVIARPGRNLPSCNLRTLVPPCAARNDCGA